MADKNIKTVIIPLPQIESVQNDGTILLRYKVKSTDGSKNSHWSKIYKVNPGVSFSELNGYDRPYTIINSSNNELTYVTPTNNFLSSSVSKGGMDAGANTFTVTWGITDNASNTKYFDIYVSWYDLSLSKWTNISYVGSTTNNVFTFQRPSSNTTYILAKAMITVSSFPKLTIYDSHSAVALSITDPFSTWISATGTMNLTSFTIPTQTTTASGGFVTIKTSTPHGFTVGQVTDISGVTPSGYNGIHTITEVVDNYTFKYYDASPPATTITVAGTIKNRYIATITGLTNSFPIKNIGQEVVTSNTDMGYGGAAYTGKMIVTGAGSNLNAPSNSRLK